MNWQEVRDKLRRTLASRKFQALVVAIITVLIGGFGEGGYVFTPEMARTILFALAGFAGLATAEDVGYYVGVGAAKG